MIPYRLDFRLELLDGISWRISGVVLRRFSTSLGFQGTNVTSSVYVYFPSIEYYTKTNFRVNQKTFRVSVTKHQKLQPRSCPTKDSPRTNRMPFSGLPSSHQIRNLQLSTTELFLLAARSTRRHHMYSSSLHCSWIASCRATPLACCHALLL
jgi:hypothetical protein